MTDPFESPSDTPRGPSRRRTSHPGALWVLVKFYVGLVVALALLLLLLKYGLNPWAWSLAGRPTLTGNWQGHVTGTTNGTGEMFLTLALPSRIIGRNNITGSASLCDSLGARRTYQVEGSVNALGQRLRLRLLPPHGSAQHDVYTLRGVWRPPRLELVGEHEPATVHGGIERESASLTKGTEAAYEAACRAGRAP